MSRDAADSELEEPLEGAQGNSEDPTTSGQTRRDEATRRCGGCGGPLGHECTVCTFCGAAVEGALSQICRECFARNEEEARFCAACGCGMDGTGYGEVQDAPLLPCPRCPQEMPARRIGSFPAHECESCNGLWVPGQHFDALVEAAVKARQQKQIEMIVPDPRHTGANPVTQDIAYRRCPECRAMMQRRNFRKRSGVILDVCRDHGTWLDADELERVVGFILDGGIDYTPAKEDRRESYAAGEFTRILAEERSGIFGESARQERPVLKQVLSILSDLLTR